MHKIGFINCRGNMLIEVRRRNRLPIPFSRSSFVERDYYFTKPKSPDNWKYKINKFKKIHQLYKKISLN